MRSPDSIQILLRVRSQREEVEERKLAAIIERLKVAQAELAKLSAELEFITTTRVSEIQSSLPNTHHREVESHSRSLWRRCADQAAEITSLKAIQAQQMSVYLSAHREREVVESLNKRRLDARNAETRLREQKLNEDLFLARRGAKWDTRT
jgi:flagellar export protein FliJ